MRGILPSLKHALVNVYVSRNAYPSPAITPQPLPDSASASAPAGVLNGIIPAQGMLYVHLLWTVSRFSSPGTLSMAQRPTSLPDLGPFTPALAAQYSNFVEAFKRDPQMMAMYGDQLTLGQISTTRPPASGSVTPQLTIATSALSSSMEPPSRPVGANIFTKDNGTPCRFQVDIHLSTRSAVLKKIKVCILSHHLFVFHGDLAQRWSHRECRSRLCHLRPWLGGLQYSV